MGDTKQLIERLEDEASYLRDEEEIRMAQLLIDARDTIESLEAGRIDPEHKDLANAEARKEERERLRDRNFVIGLREHLPPERRPNTLAMGYALDRALATLDPDGESDG